MPTQESQAPSIHIVGPQSSSSDEGREPSEHHDGHAHNNVKFATAEPPQPPEPPTEKESSSPLWRFALQHHWVSWIPAKLTWTDMKPVIRCALAAWAGLVIELIHPSELALGNAAFFVLVVAYMLPPSQSTVQILEIFTNLFFFTGLAWAWVCLGVFVADKTRVPTSPSIIAAAEAKWASLADNPTLYQFRIIYDGTYLQAKPAVICAVFLAVGTGALLWWKLRTAPSPATFPLVLSCILIDVSLSIVPLYPTAFYTSGLLFFKPMAVQGGIAVILSLLVFPESVSAQFQSKLAGVLDPITKAVGQTRDLFGEANKVSRFGVDDGGLLTVEERDFDSRLIAWADKSEGIRTELLGSLARIPPLRAQERYLAVDISFGRLSGKDLRQLFVQLAAVQARASGMAFFFDIVIANTKHSHIDSSAFSAYEVSQSRPSSRPASVRHSPRDSVDLAEETNTPPAEDESRHDSYFGRRLQAAFHRRSGSPHGLHHHKGSYLSLLDHLRKAQQPVGVYESQRYMDVERAVATDTDHMLEQLELLAVSSVPIISVLETSLQAASHWCLWVDKKSKKREPHAAKIREETINLQSALDDFREARLNVIKPYHHLFDPTHPPPDTEVLHQIKHRGLFCSFVAQYHLIEFTESLLSLMRKMEELDQARPKRRLWYPKVSSLLKHFSRSHRESRQDAEDPGEENEAFNEDDNLLGEVRRRNPDFIPFENPLVVLLSKLSRIPDLLWSRSAMYAVKAGLLGVLTCLPAFCQSTASFYYYNRGIWCTIMAQLTLAVFSGDTTSAWIARLFASFWGCLAGMVVWYIGSGSGQGNAYGLGAICAVTFPFAMFFRLHFPGQILTSVMSTVTFGLVIGYSYLNGTDVRLTNAGWGWDVAWRRFVCVIIGITAAWIFCFVPPRYSGKRAIRDSYSRTISTAGNIFCDVLSSANDPHQQLRESDDMRAQLLVARTKLTKLGIRHALVRHEYSLRGRWPEERYQALLTTLQDLMSLLAQLNHVLSQLDRPWRRAFLDRTRLADPLFLSDILAVISMTSTALRAGTALPQITPSPLVERWRMGKSKGLDVPTDPADPSHEIPSLVSIDVLESESYMRYALAVTTTYSLISRLDSVVVVCKTLLGENFHISNMHLPSRA